MSRALRLLRSLWAPAAVITLVLVLALPILTYPFGLDHGLFAVVGEGIVHGQFPYVDLWDTKPPAVYYTYALSIALFGPTIYAPRTLDFVVILVVAVGLYRLGQKLFADRRLSLMVILVFAALYLAESYWTLAQNDGFAMVPLTLLAVCLFEADRSTRHRRLYMLLAGVCGVLALWFKYPFIVIIGGQLLGYLIWQFVQARHGPASAWIRQAAGDVLFFALGGLLGGLPGVIYMAANGVLGAWIESALLSLNYQTLPDPTVWQGGMNERLGRWGLLAVIMVVGFALKLFTRPPATESQHPAAPEYERPAPGWIVIWAWLGMGVLNVFWQAKGFDYHWLPLLPAFALLVLAGGRAIFRLAVGGLRLPPERVHAAETAGVWVVSVALVVAVIANVWLPAWPYMTGKESQRDYYAKFVAGAFSAEEQLMVAEYLRERVAPGDTLYIWGYGTDVYYLSRLRPATRFIFHIPLATDWVPDGWRQENVDILWAAMPPYVLVKQGDYGPSITGTHKDSHELLQEYTELNNWLMHNYEPETEFPHYIVWRRKDM
ncbi:MAG: glycosyltransferase family 39 protein [Anaerolineae bacterium]|nr:glycosyltransferase family 39 protein [Anaerolineae bacterium]